MSLKVIEKLSAEVFGRGSELIFIEENNSEFKYKFEIRNPKKPELTEITELLTLFPARDEVTIELELENQDSIYLHSRGENKVSAFVKDHIDNLENMDDGDILEVSYTVKKVRVNRQQTIYSLKQIGLFWQKEGIISALDRIEELRKDVSIFLCDELDATFNTNAFTFAHSDSVIVQNHAPLVDRDALIAKRNKVAHFANAAQYSFVPEDFIFDNEIESPEIKSLFIQLSILSSMVFLCDFSIFKDPEAHFRINGYRLFTKDINTSENTLSNQSIEYVEIYKWAFTHGDVVDKAGLARNIISLHIDNDDLMKVQKSTLVSITSGYQVYLKDNVKQYIEIKNKLSEFIQGSSEKASEIAKSLGSFYKNSAWTLYSFFASVFIIRSLNKNTDDLVLVTDELFFIFFVFAIFTLLMMYFALNEMDEEEKRFVENYGSLKSRYKDLLLPEDLAKILDNDKQFKTDIAYIKRKKIYFKNLWVSSLVLMFIAVSILWIHGGA